MAGRVSIVGLGPGALSGLPREASQVSEEATAIFLRTVEHPAAREIAARYPCAAFDSAYAAGASFEDVYRIIVDQVMAASRRGETVVYAVPGDPMVGEATTGALVAAAGTADVPLRILHAAGFLEPCLELAGMDALGGAPGGHG